MEDIFHIGYFFLLSGIKWGEGSQRALLNLVSQVTLIQNSQYVISWGDVLQTPHWLCSYISGLIHIRWQART